MNLEIKSTALAFGFAKIMYSAPKMLALMWLKVDYKITSLESDFLLHRLQQAINIFPRT